MNIVVFGAGGQLGSMCKELLADATFFSQEDVDITDREQVQNALSDIAEPVVINAAAYTDVVAAESEIALSFAANAAGPLTLAKVTMELNGILIHISTDYVFDGTDGDYTEDSEPGPLNVYGLSKLAGEYAVRAYNPHHYILRTSALFGPTAAEHDNNFVYKRLAQMKANQPIKMVADLHTVPTYTRDLVHCIQKLIERDAAFGTYHVVNDGGSVTWYDFTVVIAQQIGYKGVIEPVSSATQDGGPKRPKDTTLNTKKLKAAGIQLPDWQNSLRDYIEIVGMK